MRLLLAATALMLVLAGCTSQSDDDPNDGVAPGADGVVFQPYAGGDASTQPRMRFAAAEYSQTLSFDDSFESTGCNPILAACPGHEVRFDLTPQVPAGAPVELSATVTSDTNCLGLDIESTDTALQSLSIEDEEGKLAANLVRKASGTVTLVAYQCNGLNGFSEGSAPVPVHAEVSSVVRPDVLPPYMPVTAHLAPGDHLLAMGMSADSIEDLIVIPPGLPAIHLVDTPEFNVTATMPTGDYILVVKGAEAMLHGPNVTLTPAPIQHFIGEERDLPSGESLSWTTPVPGVVAYAAIVLGTGHSSNGLDDPTFHFVGDFRIAILQDGHELAMYQQGCGIPCNINGPGGSMSTSTGTGFFPEDLGIGDLTFEVENSMSQGSYAYEVIGYIDLASR